jgi:hypothetical protein
VQHQRGRELALERAARAPRLAATLDEGLVDDDVAAAEIAPDVDGLSDAVHRMVLRGRGARIVLRERLAYLRASPLARKAST